MMTGDEVNNDQSPCSDGCTGFCVLDGDWKNECNAILNIVPIFLVIEKKCVPLPLKAIFTCFTILFIISYYGKNNHFRKLDEGVDDAPRDALLHSRGIKLK